MAMSTWHVYTDGSCINQGSSNASSGIGVYWEGTQLRDSRNLSEKPVGLQDAQRAELIAVQKACNQAARLGVREMIIWTDSEFVINQVNNVIRENNWSGHVEHKDDLRQLDLALQKGNYKVEKVKAHSGNSGNDRANQLAREAASGRRFN